MSRNPAFFLILLLASGVFLAGCTKSTSNGFIDTPMGKCKDTDTSLDPHKTGVVTLADGEGAGEYVDYCETTERLVKYECTPGLQGKLPKGNYVKCPFGELCQGICKKI